jgi:hypothetical protein
MFQPLPFLNHHHVASSLSLHMCLLKKNQKKKKKKKPKKKKKKKPPHSDIGRTERFRREINDPAVQAVLLSAAGRVERTEAAAGTDDARTGDDAAAAPGGAGSQRAQWRAGWDETLRDIDGAGMELAWLNEALQSLASGDLVASHVTQLPDGESQALKVTAAVGAAREALAQASGMLVIAADSCARMVATERAAAAGTVALRPYWSLFGSRGVHPHGATAAEGALYRLLFFFFFFFFFFLFYFFFLKKHPKNSKSYPTHIPCSRQPDPVPRDRPDGVRHLPGIRGLAARAGVAPHRGRLQPRRRADCLGGGLLRADWPPRPGPRCGFRCGHRHNDPALCARRRGLRGADAVPKRAVGRGDDDAAPRRGRRRDSIWRRPPRGRLGRGGVADGAV